MSTYIGWDGREYEDQERDNMREQHPCGIDCIDPAHDPEYDRIERAAFHRERDSLGAQLALGHDVLFPECDKPLPHEHTVRVPA